MSTSASQWAICRKKSRPTARNARPRYQRGTGGASAASGSLSIVAGVQKGERQTQSDGSTLRPTGGVSTEPVFSASPRLCERCICYSRRGAETQRKRLLLPLLWGFGEAEDVDGAVGVAGRQMPAVGGEGDGLRRAGE